MKKFMKVVALVLVFSMVLAGCGAKSNSGSAKLEMPKDSEKVTIRFSWWGSDNRHEAMQEVAKLYMEKHPNITIECEYGAFDGWQQKVLTQLSGKTEPDVMQVNYNWVHSFGKGKNVFYNLNDLGSFIDLTQWEKLQLDSMTVGGELGAVPHGITARANLYNKALFSYDNIFYPKTYDQIIEVAKVIAKDNTATGANNQYVLTNIGKVSTDLFIAQMLYNKTGKVMQENGKINYTVEEVQQVLETYKSFEDCGAFPTFEQEDPIQNESNPVWTSGRSGSVYEWVGTMDKYLLSYKDGASQEISVAPYVTEKEGDNVKVYVKPSLGFAVSKNSKNPAVAADFLNFMFTNDEAIKLLGTSLGVSSNAKTRSVQESEGMVKGAMKEGYDLLAEYEQVMLDPYFEDENVRGERYIAIESFRTGKSTSAEAAKAYIEKQQAELDKLMK